MRVLLTRCNILNDVVSVNGADISPYSPSAKFPGRFWCVRDFSVHLASRRLRAERRTGLADPPRTTRSAHITRLTHNTHYGKSIRDFPHNRLITLAKTPLFGMWKELPR